MNEQIDFDITIYEDALSLLLSDKTDIRAEILNQLQQGDPVIENIDDELFNLCDELVLDTEKVMARFKEESCEDLMKYIAFSDAGITFDYGESQACGDLRTVAFSVMCTFDAGRYLEERGLK